MASPRCCASRSSACWPGSTRTGCPGRWCWCSGRSSISGDGSAAPARSGSGGRRRGPEAGGPVGDRGELGRDAVAANGLLDERDARHQVVADHGADLVLDLEVARDLARRQHLAQLGRVLALERRLGLLDRDGLLDQLLGAVVGQRVGPEIVGVALQLRGDALIDRLEILLILVVDRPEALGLRLGQIHVGRHKQFLVGPDLVAQDREVVDGRARVGGPGRHSQQQQRTREGGNRRLGEIDSHGSPPTLDGCG